MLPLLPAEGWAGTTGSAPHAGAGQLQLLVTGKAAGYGFREASVDQTCLAFKVMELDKCSVCLSSLLAVCSQATEGAPPAELAVRSDSPRNPSSVTVPDLPTPTDAHAVFPPLLASGPLSKS